MDSYKREKKIINDIQVANSRVIHFKKMLEAITEQLAVVEKIIKDANEALKELKKEKSQ